MVNCHTRYFADEPIRNIRKISMDEMYNLEMIIFV